MTHEFAGEKIDFNIVYKKRKTMGIYIDIYGHIEVRVPKGITEESILKMIESKWNWILEKSKEMKEKTNGYHEKVYEDGEKFLYLGKSYPIVISYDINLKQENVVFDGDKLRLYVREHDEERIKQTLQRFYYQQCKSIVEKRIQFYQSNFKTKPRSIRIANNKSNWGTCNSKYELTFNWKLAMAPLEAIDYVVVHELCHMVHLNHDRSFWRLVGKILPDYEQRQSILGNMNWKMTI